MTSSHGRDIYSVFADTARRRPRHPAVIYLGNQFTYGRIKDLAGRFAAALSGLGIGPGQKVMMYIPNSIQWVVSWLGIQKLGAVAVPITPIYTPMISNISPRTVMPKALSAQTLISVMSPVC